MAFQYCEFDEIERLINAAAEAGLADPAVRPNLFVGVPIKYVTGLPTQPTPALQLRSDLNQMNEVDRLIDGTVPLELWLRNAAAIADPKPQARVFREFHDRIAGRATNEPEIPLPANVAAMAEAIVHKSDLLNYSFLDRGAKAGAAVARLVFPSYENGEARLTVEGAVELHAGTGWMLTPELMVTNHHVIVARERDEPDPSAVDLTRQVKDGHAEFGYDYVDAPKTSLGFAGLEMNDATLDFALLRLAKPFTGNPLRVSPKALKVKSDRGPALNIIQHPSGGPKQVANSKQSR